MNRIITALDFADVNAAREFVASIDPSLTRLKVGNQLFTLGGPRLIEEWQKAGFDIFLDLKYHDIPNTVASALQAACQLGVWMVDVHASGGPAMLTAAREAVADFDRTAERGGGTRLIAVTVLTSLDQSDMAATGLDIEPAQQVERLARLTRESGLDGVVCSPHEVGLIRNIAKSDFITVTPGVRPDKDAEASMHKITSHGGAADDQRRTLTPYDAIIAGSDYLVIGRPITQAASAVNALHALNAEVQIAAGQLSKGQASKNN
jgi:orotidine-5'-phosphate decarboxylase